MQWGEIKRIFFPGPQWALNPSLSLSLPPLQPVDVLFTEHILAAFLDIALPQNHFRRKVN